MPCKATHLVFLKGIGVGWGIDEWGRGRGKKGGLRRRSKRDGVQIQIDALFMELWPPGERAAKWSMSIVYPSDH